MRSIFLATTVFISTMINIGRRRKRRQMRRDALKGRITKENVLFTLRGMIEMQKGF